MQAEQRQELRLEHRDREQLQLRPNSTAQQVEPLIAVLLPPQFRGLQLCPKALPKAMEVLRVIPRSALLLTRKLCWLRGVGS